MRQTFLIFLVFLSLNASAQIEQLEETPRDGIDNRSALKEASEIIGANPWNSLQLIGYEAKIVDTGIPLWIPIVGGAVVLGVGAMILAQDNNPSNPPPALPQDSCNASFSIITTPAICDMPLGSAVVQGPPNIDVLISWNNGETSDSISNIFEGNISATINYSEGQCVDTLYAKVPNVSHEFDLSASILNPSCMSPGDIAISYDPLPVASASVTIVGPNETLTVPSPPQDFLLSDYVTPVSGSYNVEIAFDETNSCASSTESSLEIVRLPEFSVADIVQPSGPSISDGAIFLKLTVGIFPWTLYMNEAPLQDGEDSFAAIEGLSEGTYTLELADGRGCLTPPQTISLVAGGCPQRPPHFSLRFIFKPVKFTSAGN